MKTIHDMPSISTYCKFHDCDVQFAAWLRDQELAEENKRIMDECREADARWRARRDAERAAWVAGGGAWGAFKRLMMSVPN